MEADSIRFIALKLFERDKNITERLALSADEKIRIGRVIAVAEAAMDDDTESIMTNERYDRIAQILQHAYVKKERPRLSASDRIDKIMTNRILALPLFFLIMWAIYFIAIQTVGDWTIGWVEELMGWISGGVASLLANWGAAPWLLSLVVDGILGGLTGVFVFVPQLMILFLFISLLEDCGYMARVAFIMDRIFRRFGLSGKSFIPMLIGTGCSVPGIMASRTIENENDRKMTIMLTPFIPCGAKLPVFAMFIAQVFSNASWIGPSMYFIGMAMVIISGLVLKRTRLFAGKPAPFIMELPSYKLPRAKGVFIHMWEKGKSFVIKAGTIIFIACAVIWFLQNFDWSLRFLNGEQIETSILAGIGRVFAPVFAPLGFGNWASSVASITGSGRKRGRGRNVRHRWRNNADRIYLRDRVRIHDIHAARRTVLCRDRRNPQGNGRMEMDADRHFLSDGRCVHTGAARQSDRQPDTSGRPGDRA